MPLWWCYWPSLCGHCGATAMPLLWLGTVVTVVIFSHWCHCGHCGGYCYHCGGVTVVVLCHRVAIVVL